MKNLHKNQEIILEFIKKRKGSLGGLSLRDVGERVGIGRKPNIVAYHIEQLEKKGILRENNTKKKSYTILDSPIPLIAYIKLYSCTAECGPEGFLGEDTVVDKIPLPTKTFGISNPDDFFLIKAKGDSMEPKIQEGDLVLVKVQQDVPSGSVAVIVHDDMPKIKKLIKEKVNNRMTYCLESFNNSYPTKIVSDNLEGLRVIGSVEAVINKFKFE